MSKTLVPLEMQERWRRIADMAAEILGAAAVVIVRTGEVEVEILAASPPIEEVGQPGALTPLDGSICQAVIVSYDGIAVADARSDADWAGGDGRFPSGMVSCLGLPIRRPGGAAFGALCVFDTKPRVYSEVQASLLTHLRDGMQTDLARLDDADLAEQRYRLLAENLGEGFFLHDDEGRILDVNHQSCDTIGYSREELLRSRIWEISATDPVQLKALWARTAPGGSYAVKLQYQRRDGVAFPADVRVTCLESRGRKLFFALVRNIAARVEAEQTLQTFQVESESRLADAGPGARRSSELLQAVMDGAADAIFIKDREGRYLLFNRAAEGFVGRRAEDVLGKTAEELFGPEDGRKIRLLEQRVMQTGVASTVEETLSSAGKQYTFLATRSAYWNERGDVVGLIGILHDITEMRRAAEALRLSETRWQFAVNGAGDGIWDWNVETGHVFYSRRWKAMLGYAEDEVGDALTDWSSRVHPDDLKRCWEIVENHLTTNTPDFTLEHRMRAKDGSWRWILDRGKAIERTPDGRPLRVIGTHTDITERRLAEQELHLQRERLLLATEASRMGIWDNNLDANTLIGDARWHSIFGLQPTTPQSAVEAFSASIHPEDVERVFLERAQALAAGRKILRIDFRICTPAGETRWISSAARLIERSQSGPRRLVGIVVDVTHEREAAEALRQAKETAEAAERAKSDFLATMSHEIRTPMNTVIGMTRLTLNTDLTPKQRNYLEKIDASAKTLLAIINDVLDFSKIEAGGLRLEDTVFALEDVLEAMAAITAVRAEEKGLEIVYAIAPDAPRRLRGDPLRLGQVLTNLVANAVKFTQDGEVVVSIDLVALEKGEASLQFAVRDTGIGLDAKQIEGLFRRFSQAEPHISRQYGGTGLGLAISKQLVEMMGGRIWVESELGRGSTFYFTIQAAVAEPQEGGKAVPRALSYLSGRRVLIVDDNASARQILGEMVRGFGMLAEAAASGSEALITLRAASVADQPFDLVLMDWRMPTMDGLETARRIRAEGDHLSRMPAVLMVTAYGREEVLKSAEQLGLHGVLIKPVTESVMFNTLQDVLLQASRLHPEHAFAAQEAAARRAAAPAELEFSALRGLRVLVVDDNALNREVATDFLLQVGIDVETAVNGLHALRQLETGVYDAVLMDVHMPEMDGLTAVREIRRRPQWAELPIIALTAQARVEDRSASMAAGMTAHLTKPIDELALYRTLLEVLQLDATAGAQAAAYPVREGDEAREGLGVALKGFDAPAALARFGGDAERLQRLLQGFLRDFDDADTRFDALLHAEDLTGIAALAHALRGAAAYLEAGAFCVVAEQVEGAARRGEDEAVLAYAHMFRGLLGALLRQVRATHLGASALPETAAKMDLETILTLTAEAGPLIARGDYAAQSLLDRLCTGLAGRPEAAMADIARTHYEDLELEAANAALERLNTHLQGDMARSRP